MSAGTCEVIVNPRVSGCKLILKVKKNAFADGVSYRGLDELLCSLHSSLSDMVVTMTAFFGTNPVSRQQGG
jgi:hypothetical protein